MLLCGGPDLNMDSLTMEEFRSWPLIRMGESKEIRQPPHHPHLVVIWLRPTIYSFTQNRTGWVEGSNLLRARVMKTLIPILKKAGIRHAYREISDKTGFILANRITPEQDPNVETIIKRFNGGTSYHRYFGLHEHPTRATHPFWPGETFDKYEPFRGPKVRFDWRNPFWNPVKVEEIRRAYLQASKVSKIPAGACSLKGAESWEKAPGKELPEEVFEWPAELRAKVMMRDEVLGEDFANEIIDVRQARKTALWTYTVLQQYMARCNIVIYDLCLFITTDGKTVYGEINQDCGRFRHLDHGMLDKDVWRTGGSVGDVLEKWTLLAEMLENPVFGERGPVPDWATEQP
jgi:hypothetical protein